LKGSPLHKKIAVVANAFIDIANTEKNSFVTAAKVGTTNNFFVAATKNFAAATKRLVERT